MYSELAGPVGTGIRRKVGPLAYSHFLVSRILRRKPEMENSASNNMKVGNICDSSQDTGALTRKRKSAKGQADASRKYVRTEQVHTRLQ